MIEKNFSEAEARMKKSIESYKNELVKIRTGRAHPSLVEHVKVNYYGQTSPLSSVASVTVEDARTLNVTPWEKSMVIEIEKALRMANLGLNPVTAGQVIRLPLPPLTEERRKELVKVVRSESENAKVSIRNVRRDGLQHLKNFLKDKLISEDEERKAHDKIQKVTDRYIEEVDKILAVKEAELMHV